GRHSRAQKGARCRPRRARCRSRVRGRATSHQLRLGGSRRGPRRCCAEATAALFGDLMEPLDPPTRVEGIEARRAGARMIGIGFAFLVAGLILVVVSDWKTGGSVTHPEIAREGHGISLLAGMPASIGYVVGAMGVYRLLSGRGPGHASKHPIAI